MKNFLIEIFKKLLKISYEGLDDIEKHIFLDIACFFKGYCMDYDKIVDILEACGLYPVTGFKKLIDKCLLTNNKFKQLSMHDLLQQMGREIVRQESPENPGERSRLWYYEDALEVLTEDMVRCSDSFSPFSSHESCNHFPLWFLFKI